jgi:predicted transposase/invertase (TIGR01784 family)
MPRHLTSDTPESGSERLQQVYDRLFREAFALEFDGVLHDLLGVESTSHELIDPSFPVVSEKSADFAFRYQVAGEANARLGQLEVQTRPDANMLQRCLLYSAHFYHKYKQVPQQYVLHLGTEPWNYPTALHTDDLKYSFRLIRLQDLDAELLLGSSSLSIAILSVLGRTGDPEGVLHRVMRRLERAALDQLRIRKYMTVLLIAAGLRPFTVSFIKTVKRMPIVLENLKQHPLWEMVGEEMGQELYYKGEEKGLEKGKLEGLEKGKLEATRLFARRMLEQQFPVATVCQLTGLSEVEVEAIRQEMPTE